ncbi:MAG: alpha/beta fold hydrolase [Acidimicrobiia bacterium]|nr:alpha/beta fold hydrolase [Acidimicrobiia bacterium]MDH3396920.1 alpha/beta fold hydrolase [Acidimicrobiia bacterium]MDH5616328.1 alpha/beta fold hydrolase [Acidimicrobiia bacterium]
MHFVEVGDTTLAYQSRGGGDLAVFVHGFPLDHRLWLDQLDALGDLRQCVAPDLRGSGSSDAVASLVLAMEQVADDLAELIESLGHTSADVVSLSMGGYGALALWERHPERVRSLVLMDTRPGADSEAGRAGRRETAERVADEGGGVLVASLQKALLAPGAELAARVRLRGMIEATAPETIVASLEGMARRADRTDILSSITVPTLVMVGADDGLTPPDMAEHMAELIPTAELVVIPGAGHLPPIETPEAVNDALRAFWERSDS